MTEYTVVDAIDGLKTALLMITPPAGVDLDDRVWAWPKDRASVDYGTFPFIICAQVLSESAQWLPMTQGVGEHNWPAEVLICLNNETSRDDVSATDEAAAQAWLLAAGKIFFNNRSLVGTAIDIGIPEALFTSQIGNMGWLSSKTFWGVYCRIMVHQIHSLPSL
jgi:hypothetical protein